MVIATQASKFSLPQENPGVTTVLEYLVKKFPAVSSATWLQRMDRGKVHWHDGSLITATSPFQAQQRVYYYRELAREEKIPFEESILFQDEHLLVAFKPHFLPVTPGGIYINECLQNRLKKKTGNDNLQALHRLDRVTAGLVLFSTKPESRHFYHTLFESRQITKTYQAIAKVDSIKPIKGMEWDVANRIEKSSLGFRMQVSDGNANSHSLIRCVKQVASEALFELKPTTGKTHQLRVHMQSLGYPILNDRYYPSLQAEAPRDFSSPLQLLAKELRFIDPISQQARFFDCGVELSLKS